MTSMDQQMKRKRVAPLTIVLGIVFVFFCGILIWAYVETKRANPIMLDEHGNPINQSSQQPTGGKK